MKMFTTPRRGSNDFKHLCALQAEVDRAFDEGTDEELAAAKAAIDAFCNEHGYYWT